MKCCVIITRCFNRIRFHIIFLASSYVFADYFSSRYQENLLLFHFLDVSLFIHILCVYLSESQCQMWKNRITIGKDLPALKIRFLNSSSYLGVYIEHQQRWANIDRSTHYRYWGIFPQAENRGCETNFRSE